MKCTISAKTLFNMYKFISNFVEKDRYSIYKHRLYISVNNNTLSMLAISNSGGLKRDDCFTEALIKENCDDTENGNLLISWKDIENIKQIDKSQNVTLLYNNDRLEFISSNYKFSIPATIAEGEKEYKFVSKCFVTHIASMNVTKEELKGLNFTALAMNNDEVCLEFNGLFYDEGSFVATDGRRMHVYKTNQKVDGKFESIIPKNIIKCFNKGLVGELQEWKDVLDQWFVYTGDNFIITSKGIKGKFTDYRKVMSEDNEKNRYNAIIDAKSILSELKSKTKGIKTLYFMFSQIKEDVLHFFNSNKEYKTNEDDNEVTPEIEFDIKCNNANKCLIRVNINYLKDAITGMGDNVKYTWLDEESPLCFYDDSTRCRSIVMPVQLLKR